MNNFYFLNLKVRILKVVLRISETDIQVEKEPIELEDSQKYLSDFSILSSLIFRRNLDRLIYELYGGKIKVISGNKLLAKEWIKHLFSGEIKSYLEIGPGFSTYPREIVEKMAKYTTPKVLMIDKNKDAINYQRRNLKDYNFVDFVTDEISSQNIGFYTSSPFDLCILSKVLPYIGEREEILKVVAKNCKRVVVMSYWDESGIKRKGNLLRNYSIPQEISNSLTNLENYFKENELGYLILINAMEGVSSSCSYEFYRLNIFTRKRYP